MDINNLQMRHDKLDKQIKKLYNTTRIDNVELKSLKIEKLKLKDQIEKAVRR
tara:strand:- start:382 stop:537 length:156 start_codon:yes stop_codon:yes gene_type:complete